MNYLDLVIQIKTYANKFDNSFNIAIPRFIEMGQQRIWRELTGIEFEKKFTTGQFLLGNSYLKKPVDWNKTISLSYGTLDNFSQAVNILKSRTYEFCRAYWPDANKRDDSNPPEFYSDVSDDNFFISPTPNKLFRYELTYLKRIDPIKKADDTNVLTDNYPDLLFYACFLEALAYLRDDERIQIYEQNYQRALQSAQQKTSDRHMDRTTNRDID